MFPNRNLAIKMKNKLHKQFFTDTLPQQKRAFLEIERESNKLGVVACNPS